MSSKKDEHLLYFFPLESSLTSSSFRKILFDLVSTELHQIENRKKLVQKKEELGDFSDSGRDFGEKAKKIIEDAKPDKNAKQIHQYIKKREEPKPEAKEKEVKTNSISDKLSEAMRKRPQKAEVTESSKSIQETIASFDKKMGKIKEEREKKIQESTDLVSPFQEALAPLFDFFNEGGEIDPIDLKQKSDATPSSKKNRAGDQIDKMFSGIQGEIQDLLAQAGLDITQEGGMSGLIQDQLNSLMVNLQSLSKNPNLLSGIASAQVKLMKFFDEIEAHPFDSNKDVFERLLRQENPDEKYMKLKILHIHLSNEKVQMYFCEPHESLKEDCAEQLYPFFEYLESKSHGLKKEEVKSLFQGIQRIYDFVKNDIPYVPIKEDEYKAFRKARKKEKSLPIHLASKN